MGKAKSKLPPLVDKDLKTVLSSNLREEHLLKLLGLFKEVDVDYSGAWSVAELFKVSLEARISVRAPIIEALFFMGDSRSEGSWSFSDFLVTLTSFCALSREEVLQLLFIIMDATVTAHSVRREELMEFFAYVPVGSKKPVFPVNNSNALEKFRQGKWTSLEFDGLAQLCEHFPYIPYPAYHTQELFRTVILGKAFWEGFDKDRRAILNRKVTRVAVPGTRGAEKVDVKLPVRCTMQELLEFSRRKTAVNNGKRVEAQITGKIASKLTKERDLEIQRCPILSLIRNPRCMYHVPHEEMHKLVTQNSERPEFEIPSMTGARTDLEATTPGGVVARQKDEPDQQLLESFGADDSDEEQDWDEESEEEDSVEFSDEEEEEARPPGSAG
eukprot:CAMPEP_0177346322 /NCGR_PEP_ID=MMETSP0368-20130122/29123_1 /TAXON_ID=447022 ORGANISM="Scrippsiella hangoei-like, Strain SHHI-4" /NCGR_SAMPLE_ID=MMETSP0368 /ASSEMBLY_ACC=CAM_ASM_000363 /LENGTH=384 /DNA_ID=CAMNT_0018807965 /DNA_START=14 /DNA_END=1169 /DNA_ORIENTATION=+